MTTTARRAMTVMLALAALAVPATTAGATPAPAAVSGCPTGWGSLPESVATGGRAPLTTVRPGAHPCWDRVVFDLPGPAAGYDVRYVDEVVQDGSGDVIPVPGGARLQVRLHHPAYDDNGNPTIVPPVMAGDALTDVEGFRTLRLVIYAGSFEGDTVVGVGTRARLPFRVFTLAGPGSGARIVVDVAHGW